MICYRIIKGKLAELHLLTLLQNIRSTVLCQTLVEILNCFFIFLLLEEGVANPGQGPVKGEVSQHHIKMT